MKNVSRRGVVVVLRGGPTQFARQKEKNIGAKKTREYAPMYLALRREICRPRYQFKGKI